MAGLLELLPRPKRFCYYYSIETGAKVIATLIFIAASIFLAYIIALVVFPNAFSDASHNSPAVSFFFAIMGFLLAKFLVVAVFAKSIPLLRFILWFIVIAFLTITTLVILALIGTYDKTEMNELKSYWIPRGLVLMLVFVVIFDGYLHLNAYYQRLQDERERELNEIISAQMSGRPVHLHDAYVRA